MIVRVIILLGLLCAVGGCHLHLHIEPRFGESRQTEQIETPDDEGVIVEIERGDS